MLAGGAAAIGSLLMRPAVAAGYPDHPIRVFLPVAAGTGLDVDARAILDKFATELGQAVVVVNQPQAGGNIAMEEVAKSDPDGYTLIAAGLGPVVANAYLYKRLGFNAEKDFAPVSLMQVLPSVLVVHPSLGVNSVQELIALAKSKPGQITFASQGVGTFVHLAVEQFMAVTDTQLSHIPYGRQNPFSDLAGGHVQMMISGVAPVIGSIKSGMVKALVVSAKERVAVLPDVPTAAEAGIPEFQAYAWNGLFAPRGVSEPVMARLNKDIGVSVMNPAVKARMEQYGGYPQPGTPAEFASFLSAEREKWSKVISRAKVQID
jgi:tripartite-type tricarboxylate transporter receptor subunit TctC